MLSSSLTIVASYLRQRLALHPKRPLIVGIQGPQGSGKTFLSSLLLQNLGSPPDALRVVVLSIDDLYLPHSGLAALASEHPQNTLLKGRGQPGTHDVQLGLGLLDALCEATKEVKLPSFDKSLFNGEGDRLAADDPRNVSVAPPAVDIIIMEGWCLGFQNISAELLDVKWESEWKQERHLLGIHDEFCTKADISQINENLVQYQKLWDRFDVFVQVSTQALVPDCFAHEYSRCS